MFNVLNKKNSVYIVIFFWIISVVYAYFLIPPKEDDGVYMTVALSVLNNYIPSINLDDKIVPVFFIFPTQPFINGVFLKAAEIIGYGISSLNFRLLNTIIVIASIIISVKLIQYLLKDNKYKNILAISFLILISITPFANNFYINRPEGLGILLIMIGIYLTQYVSQKENSSYLIFILIGITLGLLFIVHPHFSIYSSIIFILFIIQRIREKQYIKLITSILFFIIPFLIFLYWIFYNYENAFDQLFNRINSDLHIDRTNSVINILKNSFFISNDNFLQKIYNSFFSFPLLLIILGSIILSCFLTRKQKIVSIFSNYNLVVFFITSFIFFISIPFPGYMSMISFLMCFHFIIFIGEHVEFIKINFLKANKNFKFIIMTIFLIGLIFPMNPLIFHELKKKVTSNEYYNVTKTQEFIEKTNKNKEIFIITIPRLLPLFAKEIREQAKNNKKKILWFFPVRYSPSDNFKKLYEKEIDNALKENNSKNIIWGILLNGKSIINKDNICIFLATNTSVIQLIDTKIKYQDRSHLFVSSKKAYKIDSLENCLQTE